MKKLILFLFFIFPIYIFSQGIQLFQQFNGRYDFTAIGNTLNEFENRNYCGMLSESSATLNLLPGQTMISAHLYWASIGDGDFEVSINGTTINAERTWNQGTLRPNFGAYADVTDLVAATGNGTYTFSGLDVLDIIDRYCQYNFGGWAIYVIYEDPSLLLNQISLFDGLKATRDLNNPIELTLGNLNVTSDQFSKIGFLVWEGDRDAAVSEALYINSQLISDPPLNPANNAFNGTNSYIGPPQNAQNYNMDLDYYKLNGLIQTGDTSVDIKLTSGQDWILVHNIITKINSELPDATIVIDNYNVLCGGQFLEVNYTVRNFNSTAPLPTVPIAFYANNVQVGQTRTVNVIPRQNTESGTISLSIPSGTPQVFDLKAVVDDDGTGNGEVREISESNNEFIVDDLDLGPPLENLLILGNNQICEGDTETLTAVPANLDIYNWFLNGIPYGGNTSSIQITQSGIYTVNGYLGACFIPESPEFNVVYYPLPTVNNSPDPLIICDSDGDGFNLFFLHGADSDITISNPNLTVTYHYTFLEAQNDENILPEPFENRIAYNDEVWARIVSDSTGCYTTVKLKLEVRDSPVLTEPTPYHVCDGNNDGYAIFDFTTKEQEILGGLNPLEIDLYYYVLEQDAINAGIAALENPDFSLAIANITQYQNQVQTLQTIFVLGVGNDMNTSPNNGAQGCYDIVEMDLVVDLSPTPPQPLPLKLCDEGGGFAEFDLSLRTIEIINGQPNLTVKYFPTQAQAEAGGAGEILAPFLYTNVVPYSDSVWARVENDSTECYAVVELELIVIPLPTVNDTPSPLIACDNDGFALFNLTDADVEITLGNPNLIVTYHESLVEANSGSNPLNSPYENIVPFNQVIFVRVEFAVPPAVLSCFTTVELELVVNQLPDDSADVSDYIICAQNNSEIGTFNLDTKISEILGQQNDPPFRVSFYLSQVDAVNRINPIVNTTTHQNKDASNNPINPQTIYVGIEETEDGCYVGGNQNFQLIVKEGAIAVAPLEPFVICDNLGPIDGFATFNLNDLTNQQVFELHAGILAGQDPEVYGITFHKSFQEADSGINAIIFPYINVSNPQIIYVRVTNIVDEDDPICYAVVDMTIEVEPLQEVVLDDRYRLCVDEMGNPIREEEGGMSPPIIDTRLDPTLFTFVWELNGVILVGETSPSIIALQGGEYTVTYTELATSCQNSVSATVIVSSPPFTYEARVITNAFARNSVIEASASGEGTYHFQLDNGPFQESGIFENVSPGKHTITIKDIYGCGSVKIDVTVINFPPFFTPNNDGYHDTWNIVGIAEFDPTAKIYIFDRFGKLLKQLSPLGPGWNGIYIGNPMPSSDYWFRVEYTEEGQAKEFRGHFTLKR